MTPEWSHKIEAEDISSKAMHVNIEPTEQQCKDLARRMHIEAIDSAKASLTIQRDSKNMNIHVTGQLKAVISQNCVVSLEPIESVIETQVEGWFADPGSVISITKARHEKDSKSHDAELQILDEKDDPEPFVDGHIDLGELAAQYLSLAIDPYPHKEGVDFEQHISADQQKKNIPEVRKNPFAALKDWKKGDQG